MVEYWKFYDEYKFYADDIKDMNRLRQVTGSRAHTTYFENERVVAEDFIVPKNKLEFAKKLFAKIKMI